MTTAAASLAPVGQVIQAKIRPPFTEGWVERPRPEALLVEAVESRRVVVVSATAGSGKTTLVAAVAQRLERPVAWLTLDSTDTAPGRLVTYLEAALAVMVPRAEGVARDALAARIPHPEAAGMLVEAVAGERLVLVVDELERLGEEPEVWAVIEALLRYAPADTRVVLCSRWPVPASVLPRHPAKVVRLGNEALALTVPEAAAVLDGFGRPTVDPAAAVQATGGWITGVLFESWRIGDQGAGEGQDDPLYSYLAAQILRDLSVEDREFLIATSVLEEITDVRAGVLGVPHVRARLASLRRAHIPVRWSGGGRVLRCHPRFREYLQSELESWEAKRLRALHMAHGELLASEGHQEEATGVLLEAGATVEALEPAAKVIFDVINRLDFALAQHWLDALAGVEPEGMSPFVMARLTLAVATENHRPAVELADRLAASGKLEEVASSSSAAAFMLGECYVMGGRYDDMLKAFALAPRDADYEILRAYLGMFTFDPLRGRLPEGTGGPLDGLVLPITWICGYLAQALKTTGTSGWMREAISRPWLIAALADAGRLQEALDLLQEVRGRGIVDTSLEAVLVPHVLTDAGRREEALEAVRRGRRLARRGSSLLFVLLAGVEEARLHLRLDRDPVAALAALDPVDGHPLTHRASYLGGMVDCWYGFALLLAGRDAQALERLRRGVALYRRTGQMLTMPAVAVYLAEAEWRAGNEQAADEAADLALEAAGVQGFNHMLLSALRDFPAVLPRRLDAEPGVDSPWHELGRALRAQGVAVEVAVRPSVRLLEFGRVAILVEGEEVRPRITKTYELLAYLLTRPQHIAQRDELLEALFDARRDSSTRAYLRQAAHWLRASLPPDAVIIERPAVALSDRVAVVSESVDLASAVAHAARLPGADRLSATLAALEVVDQGAYLPGLESRWVEERRQHLRELATDARYDAAELAFSHDRLSDAERLTDTVLEQEPFHEAAWRLTMRLASVQGDDQRVLRAYQRCEQLLAEVGAEPSATTRQLVDQLRR